MPSSPVNRRWCAFFDTPVDLRYNSHSGYLLNYITWFRNLSFIFVLMSLIIPQRRHAIGSQGSCCPACDVFDTLKLRILNVYKYTSDCVVHL
jgi:hypothetical protein